MSPCMSIKSPPTTGRQPHFRRPQRGRNPTIRPRKHAHTEAQILAPRMRKDEGKEKPERQEEKRKLERQTKHGAVHKSLALLLESMLEFLAPFWATTPSPGSNLMFGPRLKTRLWLSGLPTGVEVVNQGVAYAGYVLRSLAWIPGEADAGGAAVGCQLAKWETFHQTCWHRAAALVQGIGIACCFFALFFPLSSRFGSLHLCGLLLLPVCATLKTLFTEFNWHKGHRSSSSSSSSNVRTCCGIITKAAKSICFCCCTNFPQSEGNAFRFVSTKQSRCQVCAEFKVIIRSLGGQLTRSESQSLASNGSKEIGEKQSRWKRNIKG